jgi:hypothetical protein
LIYRKYKNSFLCDWRWVSACLTSKRESFADVYLRPSGRAQITNCSAVTTE